MIYTSRISYLRHIPDNLIKISIMRWTPRWCGKYIFNIDKSLAPNSELLRGYKDGKISKEEYTKVFTEEVLFKLTKEKIDELYKKDVVLLCACKKEDFCHRFLIRDYVKEKWDIDIVEL